MTLQAGITYSDTTSRALVSISDRLMSDADFYGAMNDGNQEQHRGALPATVVTFDPVKQTIVAQPTVREKITDAATGNIYWQALPQLQDLPVVGFGGGGLFTTFPIKPGDEALLIFADTNIDSWYTSGGIQNYNMSRRHSLADGFAIVGLRNQTRSIQNYDPDAFQIRNEDGSTLVQIKGESVLPDGGIAVPFDSVEIKSNTASVKAGKTIKVEVIGGVPVPLVLDTLDFNGERFRFNGVDFLP